MTGATAGVALGLMSWRTSVAAEQLQSTGSGEESYAQLIANVILETSQRRALSREETNTLVNFIYAHRQRYQGQGLAISFSPPASENIYAYIGPARAGMQLDVMEGTREPTPREIRQLGFRSIQLRDSERASTSAPSASSPSPAQGSVSQFEAQVTTQLAKKKLGKRQPPQPAVESTSPTATASEARFIVDESQITHLMGGAEGRSIGLTLGHLQKGRFAAVNWHSHADRLWSADLHGYPGSTRRGAFRLMLEHTGGRNYRAIGVRDPHRR